MQDNIKEKIEQLNEKFDKINQNTETHLEGLLWAKPITYWDYIQTDALLNLQIQRTTLPDEMVFIMYHQVNELLFKKYAEFIVEETDNELMCIFLKNLHYSKKSFNFSIR